MTLAASSPLGQTGYIESPEGFRVEVIIRAIRRRYGKVDYQVSPLNDPSSLRWVLSSRVQFL